MRLVDLDPKWIGTSDGRSGVGVRFMDPSGKGAVRILFSNPLDGGDPLPNDENTPSNNGGMRWLRYGETFEALTITPSIDCGPEMSHFCVTDGSIN